MCFLKNILETEILIYLPLHKIKSRVQVFSKKCYLNMQLEFFNQFHDCWLILGSGDLWKQIVLNEMHNFDPWTYFIIQITRLQPYSLPSMAENVPNIVYH